MPTSRHVHDENQDGAEKIRSREGLQDQGPHDADKVLLTWYTNNEKFMLKLPQYPEPITPSGN